MVHTRSDASDPPPSARLRWPWLLVIVATSLVAAAAIVFAAVPNRVNMMAARTDEDAFIPLRQLSAHEAAYLLEHAEERKAHVAVVTLSSSTVSLATTHYLVPWWSGWPTVGPPTTPDGYHVTLASWAGLNYSILYEIDRGALERELGRTLKDEDVRPEFTKTFEVSLAPARLRLYALTEIVFLAVWPLGLVFGLLLGLRRPRGCAWVLALVWMWLCAPVAFVAVYSPAFLGPDSFYQRIVVEGLASGCLGVLWLTALPALLCAIVWVVGFVVRLFTSRLAQ